MLKTQIYIVECSSLKSTICVIEFSGISIIYLYFMTLEWRAFCSIPAANKNICLLWHIRVLLSKCHQKYEYFEKTINIWRRRMILKILPLVSQWKITENHSFILLNRDVSKIEGYGFKSQNFKNKHGSCSIKALYFVALMLLWSSPVSKRQPIKEVFCISLRRWL